MVVLLSLPGILRTGSEAEGGAAPVASLTNKVINSAIVLMPPYRQETVTSPPWFYVPIKVVGACGRPCESYDCCMSTTLKMLLGRQAGHTQRLSSESNTNIFYPIYTLFHGPLNLHEIVIIHTGNWMAVTTCLIKSPVTQYLLMD